MIRPILAIALAAAGLAGCGEMNHNPGVQAPAATALGEPVSCIQLNQIDNLRYYGDYTIDFEMKNRALFRNTLPGRCPELGFEERIAYKTSLSQLCDTDVFTVLHSDGTRGATCGFGKFAPIRLDSTKR
jgi:hypothetical protein